MDALKKFSDADGKELVKIARKTVTELLQNDSKINDPDFNSKFNFDSGVFVTINKQNSLRGCIGFPFPVKSLSEGLIDAAIAAATEDPRFSPVTPDELDQIIFEVTVLTSPIEIKVEDPMDYLLNIKIGRDGLIIENEYTSGLLLPQVPTEYGWNEEEFLCNTCEKAGLNKEAWKDSSTKVSRFEGMIFKEESPNGEIIRESSNDFL
ncbi:MAG: TIGR00296 family protein [Nitrosopumilus sp.]|nr:TIGR00296 family protein [Nitrosopumilus sp.]MDH3736045.1 TIGR00296 family protein [Nitrosopumilus sp.]MDH3823617.1 TIGR00296 family protein [Nitrosopumilus sp.]MDH3833628.1 TIGR00296 family protein [Nitrosopumilus sp.]